MEELFWHCVRCHVVVSGPANVVVSYVVDDGEIDGDMVARNIQWRYLVDVHLQILRGAQFAGFRQNLFCHECWVRQGARRAAAIEPDRRPEVNVPLAF